MSFDAKSFLHSLTERPGVYQMLAADGAVLYVGKAKNLRKRVASYFRTSGLAPRTAALVQRIAGVEVAVTRTELEALILEQNLIKQYRPPFNILFRDDKSYPYLYLSDRDPFPRLAMHRGAKRAPGSYFGPYPNALAVRETLTFLKKTFRVRQCEDSVFRHRSRPCLQYQIGRCTAPCVGYIEAADYARDVEHTRLFLEGKERELTRELEGEMEAASRRLDFERAAALRDQIAALRRIQADQAIEAGSGDLDVIGVATGAERACVHMLHVRRGRMLGSRSFYPALPPGAEPGEVLAEFVSQHYLERGVAVDIPRELLLGAAIEEAELLEAALAEAAGRAVAIRTRPRAARARWVETAQRTAAQNLAGHLAASRNTRERLEALAAILGLPEPPQRLECFDVSHSSGEAAVASCVVFGSEGPLKSHYRRFNIEGVAAGDDYAALEQALARRYRRLQQGEGQLPDVLFVDGGRGQLGVARRVLDELGVVGVLAVGVAKGTSRKPGLETLLLSVAGKARELVADPRSLLLIQQLRDEAHRFAITGHRGRRARARRTSRLEDIPGVGPKRRRELLRHFGGLDSVAQASVADLMRVPGIDRKVADAIYTALRSG
ncbi:MAG: excinuclease ABC subunit UvrC [Pseudomonadota bacterium]|jgi:excinuclease ABC subunit C